MNIYLEFIKMLVALGVVLGLLFLIMKVFKHKIMPRQGLIVMLHYQPFGPKKGIAVVRIAGEYFALGMADGAISVITRLDGSKVEECLKEQQSEEAPGEGSTLKRMLQDMKERLPWRG